MSATKSVDLDELARMHSKDECPLDRWKRYLAPAPGETDPIPWTRVTSASGACDDGFGVTDWKVRTTALGFAQSKILFGELCTLVPEDGAQPDKAKLDDLCEKAKALAGGDDAKDNGNILHAFSERVDKGQKPYIPPPYDDDIAAYRSKLDQLEIRTVPEYVERYIQIPGLSEPVMGKGDRFVWFGSTLKIADLKCGTLADYSWMKIAAQLAFYSRGQALYNARTKSHEPMPEVDQDVGLVFHVPAGQARCDVWFVDLAAGWEIAKLCLQVRAWRKRKDLAEPWRPDVPISNPDVRRARLIERIQTLRQIPGGVEGLVAIWPAGVPTFKESSSHTADELDVIALAVSTAEARVQAPFGPLDPADSTSTKAKEQQ